MSWIAFEQDLRKSLRHVGPLVLKNPKERKPEQPRKPLTFRVSDVSHIGTRLHHGGNLVTLTGVVNRREHEFKREERRKLALIDRQMSNAAMMRAMVKPADSSTADLSTADAVAALSAEFEVTPWYEDLTPIEEAELLLQGVTR